MRLRVIRHGAPPERRVSACDRVTRDGCCRSRHRARAAPTHWPALHAPPARCGSATPTTHGRLRLDGLARHLQDVANDDAVDSGLTNAVAWVVRRTLIAIDQVPALGETLTLTTFCSGTGRSWAERRTSIRGDRGGSVEAASLWVQVDAATDRIRALDDEFHQIYGDAAGGRRVSARLSLPGPATDAVEPTVADPHGRSRRPRSRQQRRAVGDPRGVARRRPHRIGTASPRSSTLHRSTSPTRRQRSSSRHPMRRPRRGSSPTTRSAPLRDGGRLRRPSATRRRSPDKSRSTPARAGRDFHRTRYRR